MKDIKKTIVRYGASLLIGIIFLLVKMLSNGETTDLAGFERAKVIGCTDGDTITVQLDNYEKYKIRFIGIDTPETKHPKLGVQFYGKEASEFTKNRLLGKTVYLQKDVSDKDRYNRLLRYIWLEVPEDPNSFDEVKNKMFNAIQVAEGYAKVYTYPPDVRYNDMFLKLQQDARDNNKGLWNEELANQWNNNESTTTSNGLIVTSLDKESEIVTIKNNSDSDLDLTGYYVVSVYGNQTFYFPDGYILNANSSVNLTSGNNAKHDGKTYLKWTSKNIHNNSKSDPVEIYDRKQNMIYRFNN